MSFMDCLPDTGGCIVGGTLVTFVLGLILLFLIEWLFPALVLGLIVKCVIVLFGGFGLQSVPDGIDTIADLQKLTPLLGEKGYSESDIAAILGTNWLKLLKVTLPTAL